MEGIYELKNYSGYSRSFLFRIVFKFARIRNPGDNVLFKVKGKNGKLIEASSNICKEAEVLFKSETTFFVESVGKIKHPINGSNKIFEIILIEK